MSSKNSKSNGSNGKSAEFRAKAVEVVYDGHIHGDQILEYLRVQPLGLYKGFVKWHNGEDGNTPHTHCGLILRDTPRLEMADHSHYEYFAYKVDDQPILPTLVQKLGKGNTKPISKLRTYVSYLCDGHDNGGPAKDTWNYKYDYEMEMCITPKAQVFLRMKRGETFDDIYASADVNLEIFLLENEKSISRLWQAYERRLALTKTVPKLRPLQEQMKDRLETQDDRKVLWVRDSKGNIGKTWLIKYLALYGKACVMSNGKKADIAHTYKGEDLVGFNLTRTSQDRVNYEAIEQLKDGLVFDTKYESNCYVRPFGKPSAKIIVMSNDLPDFTAMSSDRWDLFDVDAMMNKSAYETIAATID